jgi:endonuclease-3 related protein
VNGKKLRRVYDRLLERYGPQGWWPTTPPGATTPCYFPAPREPGQTPYRFSADQQWEIIVGAILTQNTSWSNATLALESLLSRGCLSLEHVRRMEHADLAQLIHSARYYNQKARHLQELATYVFEHHDGDVAAMLRAPGERLRPELLARRGIGPETADSIMLYAAHHPTFVIDAFARRICVRLGWAAEGVGYAQLQSLFETALPRDAEIFNEYHALIVRHAGEHCRPVPVCSSCCLRRMCHHARVAAAATRQ